MNDAIIRILARELDRKTEHISNVIDLIDGGSTIPFIARYRKEQHGTMDDQMLRRLADRLAYLRNLGARREEVKGAIEGQGKLTRELAAAIDDAATLAEVEDLYRPYRQHPRDRCPRKGAGAAGRADLRAGQAPRGFFRGGRPLS